MIQTLEDAYRLLTEYEFLGLSEMVGQVTKALSKNACPPSAETCVITDAQGRLAAIAKRFGDPDLFHLTHATRGGALPAARGPRQCAA